VVSGVGVVARGLSCRAEARRSYETTRESKGRIAHGEGDPGSATLPLQMLQHKPR
jgi:hypothetical protein